MLGPVVGYDVLMYSGAWANNQTPSAGSWYGATFGLDVSYRVKRTLLNARLLYTDRAYQQTIILPTPVDICKGIPPGLCDYAIRYQQRTTQLRVLTLPLSISHRVFKDGHFEWFAGGNITTAFLLSTGQQTLVNYDNRVLYSGDSSEGISGNRLSVGLGIQNTLCYLFTPNIGLQLEPALRLFARGSFPDPGSHLLQFQTTAAVLVKL